MAAVFGVLNAVCIFFGDILLPYAVAGTVLFLLRRCSPRTMLWIAGALALIHAIVMVLWFTDVLPVDRWLYIAVFDLDEEESIGPPTEPSPL